MRKSVILSLLICTATIIVHSQTSFVKGTVTDTAEKKNLSNSVITLLKENDSTLVQFTRSDKSGHFLIQHILPGKYVILVTYPKFADYADEIELKQNDVVDLGNILLTPKSILLANVILH